MDSQLAKKISSNSVERLWFVARGNVLKGPFTSDQLREKMAKREISFLDFCWRQGFNEWRPVGSVEDFDRRTKLKRLPQYPNVEVPASSAGGGIYLRDATPPEEENPVEKGRGKNASAAAAITNAAKTHSSKSQISFSKQRRHSISVYEWGFAMIFAVILAYYTADYAMNELSANVIRHLGFYQSGVTEHFGVHDESAVAPNFWLPLYSAPEFEEVMSSESLMKQWGKHSTTMHVTLTGQMKTHAPGENPTMENFKVTGLESIDRWTPESVGLDPIFLRPSEVSGQLNPKNFNEVNTLSLGEPILPTR